MFDFFKEIYFELNGVDTQEVKKEKKEKKIKEKESRYIFSKNIKILCIVLGIIYLFISGAEIVYLLQNSGSLWFVIKIFFQAIIDIAMIGCLLVKKKEYEKKALGMIILFFIVGYMSVFFV